MNLAPARRPIPSGRAGELVQLLGLEPHPEGGWYREIHRSVHAVDPLDGRPSRQAMTSIDFLLAEGEHSAWHRVRSDEAWHLLEGGPLRLWLMSPRGEVSAVELSTCDGVRTPRAVVPADWWQAAEPLGRFAYVGATVAPGFEFADFDFLRDHPQDAARLGQHPDGAHRLL
jgi:uncharacterized protein